MIDLKRCRFSEAIMRSIAALALAGAWVVLEPAQAQADDLSKAATINHSAHSTHDRVLPSVPECPHCRKAASAAAPPATTVAAKPVVAKADAPRRDPGVKLAQLATTDLEPASQPERALTPTQGEPPLPSRVASQTPQPVPAPAPGLPPSVENQAGETTDPPLPELPDDLKEPASSGPSEAHRPSSSVASPGAGPSSGRMPPPVFLPPEATIEGLLAELPEEPPTSPTPAPAPTAKPTPPTPVPGVYPFLDEIRAMPDPVPPPAAPSPQGGEGPSARILVSPQSETGLAMPPPAAGPLGAQPSLQGYGTAGGPGPAEVSEPRHSHLNGFSYLPVMIGDQSPFSRLTPLAPMRQGIVPGQPPTPPSPFGRRTQPVALMPWARGFKIADNQSPMPQDRLFYTFDFFDNMNGDVNRRIGSAVTDMQVYRQLLGIEKTFWRGNASVGLRLPIDTLWTGSADPSLRGNSTAVGDLTVFTKFLLYDNPALGSLLSGGLAVTAPTGPSSFAGAQSVPGFRSTQLQPYLGYILRRGDFYLQGFSAIDIPTDSRDVTMWYNDLALGYFAYQSADPSAILSAVVPTFEVHLNDPLNHRGALRANDPAGTPDVLDLTFGTSFVLRKRLVATVGCAFPVTGPRPFDVEALALLNFYYGRYGMAQPWPVPPVSR